MTITRRAQIAQALKAELEKMSQDDFDKILTPVIDTYEAPTKSWFFWFLYDRERVSELKEILKNLNANKLIVSATVAKIFNEDKKGKWLETSANTGLLRALLARLPKDDLDPPLSLEELEKLTLEELEKLSIVLLHEITISINAIKLKDLIDKKNKVEAEINQCEKRLQTIKNTLLAVNPTMNIQNLSESELVVMMQGAKQSAQEAFETHISEYQNIQNRQKELRSITVDISKQVQQLNQVIPEQEQAEKARREARQAEVKQECGGNNEEFKKAKLKINHFFKKREDAQEPKLESASEPELVITQEPKTKPRIAFKDMKVRGPESKDENFLRMHSLLQAQFKPAQQNEIDTNQNNLSLIPKV